MATLTINTKKGQFGHVPYGNVTALTYTLQADSNGLIVGSSHKEPTKIGDVIVLGDIPQGFLPLSFKAVVNSDFNAGAGDVGFNYKNGKTSTDAPTLITDFVTLPDLTAKGNKTAGELSGMAFPYDANLNLKLTTAITKGIKAGELTIVLIGVLQGGE